MQRRSFRVVRPRRRTRQRAFWALTMPLRLFLHSVPVLICCSDAVQSGIAAAARLWRSNTNATASRISVTWNGGDPDYAGGAESAHPLSYPLAGEGEEQITATRLRVRMSRHNGS